MKLDFDDPHDGGDDADDADDGHANNEVSVHEGNDVAGADEIGNGVTT